jgi:hypothetical protein
MLAKLGVPLLPYQSPRLSAIAIAPAPDTSKQHITMTVAIFDSHDREIARVVDGEQVPLIEVHRPEEFARVGEDEDAS